MMPTAEIDSDVYEFVRSNITDFGESASMVLRRLLKLPEPIAPLPRQRAPSVGTPAESGAAALSPLAGLANEQRKMYLRTATDKFLAILAFAYKEKPEAFEKVLQVAGRRRKYFARSKQEILESGKSTHPRQIPGTDYWVMTNADTRQKCDVLRRALRLLGYSDDDVRAADRAVF